MSKTLLITGGASGIGAETARHAATRGYAIAINYRTRDTQARKVVADIEASGGKAIALPGDMAREADIVRLFGEAEKALGPITHLVNSAGTNGKRGRVDEYDAAVLANLFATNVTGLMLCCREAAKRMSTRHGGKGGVIVNISSGAARNGGPGAYIDYAGSKAAVDVITTGLAKEVGGEGIRVNGVRPGFTETEMMDLTRDGDPEWLAAAVKAMPMGRLGTAREIANCVMWLVSDDASYVTGTIIDAAGGRTTA